MPIPVTHFKPNPHSLGGARFSTHVDTRSDRNIEVEADNYPATVQPLTLHISTNGQSGFFHFSLDEADALVACLTHAAALRRDADAAVAAQAKKAA